MKRCVILSAAPVMNTRGLRQLVEEGDTVRVDTAVAVVEAE